MDLGGELHIVRLHYAVPLVCSCLVLREEPHLVLELLNLVVQFYHVLLYADVTVDVGLVTVGAPAAGVEAAGGRARVVESRGQGGRAPLAGTTGISTLTDRGNYLVVLVIDKCWEVYPSLGKDSRRIDNNYLWYL